MSRTSGDRKPVGFGTHITAGGIAGAMEAVRCLRLIGFVLSTYYSYPANLWTPSKCACSSPSLGAHQGYVSVLRGARGAR